MHFYPFSILWVLTPLIVTTAAIIPRTTPNAHRPVLRDVWQFPNGTWVENLAVRSNGQILATLLSVPELYQVDPIGGRHPQLIHRFPMVTGLTGITEVEKDVFVVIAGNWSLKTFSTTPGSYSAWKVDMRPFKFGIHRPSSAAKVTKIVDIPEAAFLNGMSTLDKSGNVLISDSGAGVVWRLDTRSGDHQIAIDDPLMKPLPGPVVLGINGIHIRNGFLYFANSFRFTFNRVPIHSNGTAAGAAKVLVQSGLCDDFAFDQAGNAFMTQDPGNALQKITPEGVVTVVVGNQNSTELVGPTAAQFGRTPLDESFLYVTTNGGLAGPVNGTYVEGGKVVAVDLRTLV